MRSNLKKAGALIGMMLVIAVVCVGGSIYIKDSGTETPENEEEQPENVAEIQENTGTDPNHCRIRLTKMRKNQRKILTR